MLGVLSVDRFEEAPPRRKLRVLVADDNADALSTLLTLLETEGHEVMGVRRSVDVLGAEHEFAPDVVILDLQMPEISGYDLARWLRSRHPTRCPLLIAVTGAYTRPSDKQLSRTAGFHYHLVKPFDIDDLLTLTAWPVVRASRAWDAKKQSQ